MASMRIDQVSWHPEQAIEEIDLAGRRASIRGGEILLEAANQRVPYDTGELESSGELVESDDGASVGYTARQARYVHKHPEWHFQEGRSGHWLEEAIEATAPEVEAVVAETVRANWPR
jgi:hypothetical protein